MNFSSDYHKKGGQSNSFESQKECAVCVLTLYGKKIFIYVRVMDFRIRPLELIQIITHKAGITTLVEHE